MRRSCGCVTRRTHDISAHVMRRIFPTDVDVDVDVESSYDAPRTPPPHRPFVLLNMVTSADGAFAVDGRTRPLSSPADQHVFHVLRAIPDVILVGAQTVRAEGYGPAQLSEDRRNHRVSRG